MSNQYRQQSLGNQIINLVRDRPDSDINSSILIKLSELTGQINAMYEFINTLATKSGDNADVDGNINGALQSPAMDEIMFNNTGEDVPFGALVSEDLTIANAFDYLNTMNHERAVGVVSQEQAITSTVLSTVPVGIFIGSNGIVRKHGRVDILVDADYAPIEVGSRLVPSETKGHAQAAQHPRVPGVIGVAREQLLSGQGVVEAFIEPPRRNTNAFDAIQAEFVKVTVDLDGSVTGFSGLITDINTYRSSDMSVVISKQHFNYDASANISSSTFSGYNVEGVGESLVSRALNYMSGIINNIIQEVSN